MARPLSVILRVLAIAGSIAGLAIWYTATRLNAPLDAGSPWRLAVWAGVLLVWLFPLARLLTMNRGSFHALTHGGFYLVGLGATLLVGLWILDIVGLVLGHFLVQMPASSPWTLLALCVGLTLFGLSQALKGPAVKYVPIVQHGLAKGLQGLRIAQISDLHVSSLLGADYVQRIVDLVMAEKPDLIAVTGDLVDGPRHELQGAVAPLSGLKAPLGTFYVTGNHEYIWGAAAWVKDFKSLGFTVLDNAHRVVEREHATMLVAGINDLSAGRMGSADRPDADKAVQGAPATDFRLFLAHQPGAWPLAEHIRADLMLSGHTHAGQFFPFPGIVKLFHRYFNGLYRHKDKMWIYVNPGAGFWGPPNRLGVPTEITLIELLGAKATPA